MSAQSSNFGAEVKSPITTHVLDTATGKPAEGIRVALYREETDNSVKLAEGVTNSDGRIAQWLYLDGVEALSNRSEDIYGVYRLRFELEQYFELQGVSVFYPRADICFSLQDQRHHHIPLLLSPFGYSTYRGS